MIAFLPRSKRVHCCLRLRAGLKPPYFTPSVQGFPADFPQIRFFEVDLEETEVSCSVAFCHQLWTFRPMPALGHPARLACRPRPQELGELLGVTTLPTFLLLRSGEEVHRVEGVPQQRPARRLAQAVRQHLLGEEPQSTGGAPEQGEQQ